MSTGRNFSNEEGIRIPFDDYIELYKKGVLRLGITNSVAEFLVNTKDPRFCPNKSTSIAYSMWGWIAIAILVYSIYLSFTSSWWSFIPGLILYATLTRSTTKGNALNYVDMAMYNRDFYNNVMGIDGWLYNANDEIADFILEHYRG